MVSLSFGHCSSFCFFLSFFFGTELENKKMNKQTVKALQDNTFTADKPRRWKSLSPLWIDYAVYLHTWELIPGPQSMHAQTTHPRSQLKQVGSNPELSNTLLWHISSSSIFALILVCLFNKSDKSMHCISRYTYGKWNPGFKSVNNVHFMVKIKGKSVRIWNWLVKIELFWGCLGSVSAYETETFPSRPRPRPRH